MIQKNTDIHIRVSEKDKKALQRYVVCSLYGRQ